MVEGIEETPQGERRYRARFYFDPNGLVMEDGDVFTFFEGVGDPSIPVLALELGYAGGEYRLRARTLKSDGGWTESVWASVADEWHSLELDWRAAGEAGAEGGWVTVWVDELEVAALGGLRNGGQRIDRVHLGAVGGLDAGTKGTCSFDNFKATRARAIDPAKWP